ncbi:single-stranded DNA-binding protein [Streptomyces libani]|uniref:single-stranded DNA-binding protein n=1 Tax=Streptomyces nigrescens TaxID=1920 RepID=UPI00362AC13A
MPAERQPHTFDQAAVAKALRAKSSKLADPAYGQGWHFQVNGSREPLSLDTFPESGVSRITTKGARIELFGGSLPTVEDEGVVFLRKDAEREHSSVTLHPDGALTLGYMIDAGPVEVSGLPDGVDTGQMIEDHEAAEKVVKESADPEPPSEPAEKPGPSTTMIGRADAEARVAAQNPEPKAPKRAAGAFPDARPTVEPPATPEPTKVAEPSAPHEPSSAPDAEAGEAERQRVKLVGRLGRNPTVRETAGGKLVGKFPLAVHLEDGTTKWQDVLAFGERAAALQKRTEAGELIKGNEVEVVGYLHEREYQGRDGTAKTAQEIYSVAVTRR